MTNEYDELFKKYAIQFLISPKLAKAIASVESSFNPNAVRFEPAWNLFVYPITYANTYKISLDQEKKWQATSWGLMQVMGAVARELGFDGPLPDLLKPENAIFFGCKKLGQLHRKYNNLNDIIAAYNAGHPKLKVDGFYVNQIYVDRVNVALLKIDFGGGSIA